MASEQPAGAARPPPTLAEEARKVPFWWAMSHIAAVACTTLYAVASVLGLDPTFFYKAALTAMLAGYVLAIYNKCGVRGSDGLVALSKTAVALMRGTPKA